MVEQRKILAQTGLRRRERLFPSQDFEITENIDNKKLRIAKLKGNKIIVKLNAVALPESLLKYIVAHEIGHTTSKRHTRKFWKTVVLIYPDYIKAKELLVANGNLPWKCIYNL